MNADILTTGLTAESGKLSLPSGQSYKLMVLPEREDISLHVLRKLDTLVHAGAILIGPKPRRSGSFTDYPACDVEVQALAERLWGNCDGKTIFSKSYGKGKIYWGKTVRQVLAEQGILPDMEVTGIDNSDKHIDYVHRQTIGVM